MISQFGWNVPVIRGLERDGEDARQMWKDNITGWFMKIAMLTHKGLRKERILWWTEQAESRDIWKVTVNCKGVPVKFILNF